MHEVLVNHLGSLSLPRKSVVRSTDRPDRDVPLKPYVYLTDGNLTKDTCNALRRLQNDINYRIKNMSCVFE